MIDPGIWMSEQFARQPFAGRLLFIGCFSNADDAGRLKGKPEYLKAIIFPYDPVPLADIVQWRNQLAADKLIQLYQVKDSEFICLPSFLDYQKINRPTPSTLPPPPSLTEDSLSTHGGLTEDSLRTHPEVVEVKEIEEVVEVVEDKTNNSDNTDLFLKHLRSLPQWNENKDTKWLAEFLEDFSSFSLAHLRACRDWYEEHPRKGKANWRSRLRKWMQGEKDRLNLQGRWTKPRKVRTDW